MLSTKLFAPPLPHQVVSRPRLLARLALDGPQRLWLVSAPAGFGKSTLLRTWIETGGHRAAWLSLDEEDGDAARFLAYLVAAVRTVEPALGPGLFETLTSPQPPPLEPVLAAWLTELARIEQPLTIILDDYHVVDSVAVDEIVAALIEALPTCVRLVIATREDPTLPLARLRASGLLGELRVADLRFSVDEATAWLNDRLGLGLAQSDVRALETRTEGWAAGLQLAAISLQGATDPARFIESFAGSHRYVMDYLVEEVLSQQPAEIQTFLLRTAVLDRFCGALCDAVLDLPAGSAQQLLTQIERLNLFIVPLDDERRWYRYHHLFAELLRQRRGQAGTNDPVGDHIRASRWFAAQRLDAEAFHHAVASGDVTVAAGLVEGDGMPLHFRGVVAPVRHWLATVPTQVLDANPALRVLWASADLFVSQVDGIESKLRAAEVSLSDDDPDPRVRDLIGHIASIRATVAVTRHETDAILAQSQRALAYLRADNLPVRTATCWALGTAYQLRGELTLAHQAFAEALSISQSIGHGMITLLSTLGLALCEESWGRHAEATMLYHDALQLAGEPPLPVAAEARLGLARIALARRDLEVAEAEADLGLALARQLNTTDRSVACEVVLARVRLARGDVAGARLILARAGAFAQARGFVYVLPAIEEAKAEADRAVGAVLDPLSPRELEVLRLTAEGLSNHEIGRRLVLALSTVKGHQQRIFEKLHVRRRTEAIARARDLGLV